MVPHQASPDAPVEWQTLRLTGQDSLAARASQRLKAEGQLTTRLPGTLLRLELDRVPLWRGDHVSVRQLVEDFARYPYLPRVSDTSVLLDAISEGVGLLTWEHDAFAYADGFDEKAERYRGLRRGEAISHPDPDGSGLLVKPEVARQQLELESEGQDGTGKVPGEETPPDEAGTEVGTPAATRPKRFYGRVTLDSARVGRDASQIADEVISHLSGLIGTKVTVTLEIEAEVPSGAPDHVVRTVTENSRTLKFTSQGFEKE